MGKLRLRRNPALFVTLGRALILRGRESAASLFAGG
jgi:hypothetical protein